MTSGERRINMHNLAKDLTVVLQADRPGTLAKATEAIAKAGINIDGYAEIEGVLHVLTKDATATRQALEAAGFQARGEQQVLVIDVEDRPGVAADIFRRIADADVNVNVNFTYVATNSRIVVGANNLQKVAELLSKGSPTAPRT
jgi:hypothetical protein